MAGEHPPRVDKDKAAEAEPENIGWSHPDFPDKRVLNDIGTHLLVESESPDGLKRRDWVENKEWGQNERVQSLEIQKDLFEYQDEWARKLSEAEVFQSPHILQFAQARAEAVKLAEDYADAHADPEKRQQVGEALQAKIQELKGPLTENLKKAIQEKEDFNRMRSEGTAKETKQDMAEAVGELQLLASQRVDAGAREPVTLLEVQEKQGSMARGFESEKETNETIEAVRIGLSAEKLKMQKVEQEYLAEYKNYHATGKTFSREPAALKELEERYHMARLEYDRALKTSMQMRLAERMVAHPDRYKKEGHVPSNIADRYERLIHFREVIKPTAERKTQTRLEGLGVRERGIFARGLNWLASKNKDFERKMGGKWRARVAKAGITTVVVGGTGAALGILGAVGLAGAAGWGTWRIAKGLTGAAAGQALGELYAGTLGKWAAARAESKEKTAGRERSGELDVATLKKIDKLRESLLSDMDENTIERDKLIVAGLFSVLFGAGITAALSDIPDAPSHPTPATPDQPVADTVDSASKAPIETETTQPVDTKVPPTEPPNPPTAPQTGAELDPQVAEKAIIDGPGEGAHSLFYDLKDQVDAKLKAEYGGDLSKASAVEKAILESNPRDYASTFGFSTDTASRLMHDGDSLGIDAKGQLTFHDESGKSDIILVKANGQLADDPQALIARIQEGGMHPDNTPSIPEPKEPTPSELPRDLESTTQTEPAPQPEPTQSEPELTPENTPKEEPVEKASTPRVETPAPEPTPNAEIKNAVPTETESTQTQPQTKTPSAPEPEAPAETLQSPVSTETITNGYGVRINSGEAHLYAAPDAADTSKEFLIAYGQDIQSGKSFMQQLEELAKTQPGKTIYFQSPAPTMYNGYPQPWVTTATYSSETRSLVVAATPEQHPELVNVKLNPNTFNRLIR